jgi:D-alanyl-D-alanine carboxypeptidase (penicillin-binding protein 5/6)
MSRRYTYTPRRAAPARRSDQNYLAIIIPVAIVFALAFAAWQITSGDSGALPGEGCTGEGCAPLVGGASATPAPVVSGGPTAAPTTGPVANAPAPVISGTAAVVLEAPCGAVLHGENDYLRLPPASLAKIMTAIVAMEHAQPDEIVEVTFDGGELSLATDSTVMGLRTGDRLTMIDMIYGLLLRSGHDAALAIAEHVAADEETFVSLMNEKAAALGLTDTQFTNASGLDDPNLYTSAYDIAVLGAALLDVPLLAEVVRTHEYQPSWDRGPLENLNLLLNGYPDAIGVKTGFTDEAGQTIVAAADRDGRRLIVSVLHSEDLYVDASALLDWAYDSTALAC